MVFRAVVSGRLSFPGAVDLSIPILFSTAVIENRWGTLLDAMNRGARCRGAVLSSSPASRTKAYSTSVSDQDPSRRRRPAGDFTPVYVSLGLIALQVSLGLFVLSQQLLYSPNVYVSKKRREMFPEVTDPDWAAAGTDRFLSGSIFRRFAHLQDIDRGVRGGVSDPFRPRQPSAVHHPGSEEELRRTAGSDPHPH